MMKLSVSHHYFGKIYPLMPVPTDLLFPMSTSDVFNAIEEAISDWELLGLNLNISHSTLKVIDKDCQKVKEKTIELIQTWMTSKNMPSWSLLAEALVSCSVDRPKINEKICHQYSKCFFKTSLCVLTQSLGSEFMVYAHNSLLYI